MKRLIGMIAVFGLTLVATAAPEDVARKDQEGLQGEWRIVFLKLEGKVATKEEMAELKESKLIIKGDRWTGRLQDEVDFTFTLDPTRKPKAIDLIGLQGSEKDKKTLGIYSLRGNTFKICFTLAGRSRPTSFEGGKNEAVIEFKRAKR